MNCNRGPAHEEMVIAIAGAKRIGSCSDRGEHPKNLEGMSDVWTSTVPEFNAPAVSFKRPTLLSPSLIATSNSAKSVSHGSTLVAFTSHAKGGLQTKPLKLGTYLSITCA